LTADDALKVLDTCQASDPRDYYGRALPAGARTTTCLGAAFTVAVPRSDQREFFGNSDAAAMYEAGLGTLAAMGGQLQEIDFQPFTEASRMMFEGPWLAERYSAVGAFIAAHADQVDSAVRQVILDSSRYTAAEAFEAIHRLNGLRRIIQGVFDSAEALAVPTVGTVYRIDEVLADPIATNATNGHCLNYANIADLAAVAVPNGFLASGVPMGMTLLAPAFSDAMLVDLAGEFHARRSPIMGATGIPLPGSDERKSCA
jgi:Asp-tRNA(Asn)/Glu-tRNA(Gln) amidotransferase A subunit family amidase